MPSLFYEHQIPSYESDFQGSLTIPHLCLLFQEAASLHARDLGVSIQTLHESRLTWMLYRLHLKIHRLPAWGEKIRVETWPALIHRLYALRDFILTSEKGEILAQGVSHWMVIHLDERKPVRIPELVQRVYPENAPRAFQEPFPKIASLAEFAPKDFFRSGLSHLDFNGHVNHAAYVQWILEGFTQDFYQTHRLQEMALEYRGELFAGEEVSLITQNTAPLTFQHTLTGPSKRELVHALTLWREA